MIKKKLKVIIKRALLIKCSHTLNVIKLKSDIKWNAQNKYIKKIENESYNLSDEEKKTDFFNIKCNTLEKSDKDIYILFTLIMSQAVKLKIYISLIFITLFNIKVIIVINNHSWQHQLMLKWKKKFQIELIKKKLQKLEKQKI